MGSPFHSDICKYMSFLLQPVLITFFFFVKKKRKKNQNSVSLKMLPLSFCIKFNFNC